MAIIGNTVKVELNRLAKVPIDVTKTINPGDMMIWVPGSSFARPAVAADATLAAIAFYFIGVANDRQQIASLNQNLPFGQMIVVSKGLVVFTVDDNAAYLPGEGVTIGAGPQLIRHTGASASNVIGYVAPENNFDASAGAPTAITAVQGVTQLQIWLQPKYINLTSF